MYILVSICIAYVQSADNCYSVASNTSVTCVKVCLQNPTIFYPDTNLTFPSNASVNGICPVSANTKQNYSQLILRWDDEWFQFHFVLNLKSTGSQAVGARHDWYLANITYGSVHSNYTYTSPGSHLSIITSDSFSYECGISFNVTLTEISNQNLTVIYSMTRYQMQAFLLTENNGSFSTADVCLGPGLPYIVPLVTGLILLVMTVIPFVVYFTFVLCTKLVELRGVRSYSLLRSEAK